MGQRGSKVADAVVGQNIRFHRTSKGISQEKLAEAMGITFQQVQKYEKGTNRVSASRIADAAKALGVDILDLFSGVDVPKGDAAVVSAKAMKLMRLLSRMPDSSVDTMLAVARGLVKEEVGDVS